MNKLFKNVGNLHPGRSLFNLSYEKKFSCELGNLYPVLCEEAIPGDIWTIGFSMLERMIPMIVPLLHELNVFVHYYFVPYRILWPENGSGVGWESFITGGPTGNLTPTLPQVDTVDRTFIQGNLGDYIGYPTGVQIPAVDLPMAFPHWAYHLIWSEYYRDETIENPLDAQAGFPDWDDGLDDIHPRNWEKDYFTSALTFQQRGTAPAIPIGGTSAAIWESDAFLSMNGGSPLSYTGTTNQPWALVNGAVNTDNAFDHFNSNVVDLSDATPLNVKDLRLAFQIQKFLERNARAGSRYVEFLKSHFGVHPNDSKLQRPLYIGGAKCPIIISEVLQTAATEASTPQGNMAGHGISLGQDFICKFHVEEFGLIMGIMSIMPKADYFQGMNRQFTRKTKYDFYYPELAHISEQAILKKELYTTSVTADNNAIFGYCGAYDEMRIKHNMICGDFKTTFDYWHMARVFGSLPSLNASFINCVPRKDVFAVQNVNPCLVQFGNILKVLRPMPIIAEPGLIDH